MKTIGDAAVCGCLAEWQFGEGVIRTNSAHNQRV